MVPILELWMPKLKNNLNDEERESKIKNVFFDVLLWLNVPIVFAVLYYGLCTYSTHPFATYEVIGLIFKLSIVTGSLGINVAHELGHRQDSWERLLGKA